MSVFATLLETVGFLTLIPVLSFVDEKNMESDSDVANTIIFFFETVGISPSFFNILMIFVIIFALKGLILFLMLRYLAFTRAILLMGLRKKIFSVFAASNALNSRNITHGDQVNIFSQQTESVSQLYFSMVSVVTLLCSGLIFSLFSLIISPTVTISGIFIGAIYWLLMDKVNSQIKKQSEERSRTEGAIVQESYQFVTGFEYFKSTERTPAVLDRINYILGKLKLVDFKMATLQALSQALREPVLVFALSIMLILQYSLEAGGIGELVVSLILLYKALNSIMAVQSSYAAALSNVGSLVLFESELTQLSGMVEKSGKQEFSFKKEILFDDVTYAYPGSKSNALENVSFAIKKGEKVAIVGPSGSGKSTIIRLLLLLDEPTSGTITVDGVDSRKLNKTSYRKKIGFVTQNLNVLSGNVVDNITLGRVTKGEEKINEVIFALKNAQLDELINEKNLKDDSLSLGSSVNLSGGQLQRLCIARELFGNSDLYFFDEASSSLDEQTETKIRIALNKVLNKKTSIYVSHRAGLIKDAEKTLIVNNKTVKETFVK